MSSFFFQDTYKASKWHLHLHKNYDLQNWNVDKSREVDSVETNQVVIGDFINLRSRDFKKCYNSLKTKVMVTKSRQ